MFGVEIILYFIFSKFWVVGIIFIEKEIEVLGGLSDLFKVI